MEIDKKKLIIGGIGAAIVLYLVFRPSQSSANVDYTGMLLGIRSQDLQAAIQSNITRSSENVGIRQANAQVISDVLNFAGNVEQSHSALNATVELARNDQIGHLIDSSNYLTLTTGNIISGNQAATIAQGMNTRDIVINSQGLAAEIAGLSINANLAKSLANIQASTETGISSIWARVAEIESANRMKTAKAGFSAGVTKQAIQTTGDVAITGMQMYGMGRKQ